MKTTRIELKDSGVLFNKERHEYWLGNRQLSGITECCKDNCSLMSSIMCPKKH